MYTSQGMYDNYTYINELMKLEGCGWIEHIKYNSHSFQLGAATTT